MLIAASDTTGAHESPVDALRISALLDLAWHATAPRNLDRAISLLEHAVRRNPSDQISRNDLAVSYLASAERDQQLLPLLHALDAVERAAVAGETPAILFNRALILQRLYLFASAKGAWAKFLAAEQDEAWRREARAHLGAIERVADTSRVTHDSESLLSGVNGQGTRDFAPFVTQNPQAGRELGFALLGEWGRALLLADTARALRALALVEQIATAIERMDGDRSLTLELRVIDSLSRSGTGVRGIARAHVDFADGYSQYSRADYDAAAQSLARSQRVLRNIGAPAQRWAALYYAGAMVNQGRYDAADGAVVRLIAEVTEHEPALHGKAVWALGLSQVRRGAYEAAIAHYRAAIPHITRAREHENLGMLSSLLAEALQLAGQVSAARVETLRALNLLTPYRSRFLRGHLGLVASDARANGLHFAALAIMGEVLTLTSTRDLPQFAAWAHGELARDLLATERADAARAEIAEALKWTDSISPGRGRDQFKANIMLVNARVLRATNPNAAREILRTVVNAYRATSSEIALPQALYEASLASLTVGDTVAARRQLTEAINKLEKRRVLFPTAELRATFFETMEAVFDEMIELELHSARADLAFEYLERARAAAWDAAPSGMPSLETFRAPRAARDLSAVVPRGALAVVYALLRDRTVVWTVSRDGTRSSTIPLSRDSLATFVRRFQEEISNPDPSPKGAAARLFDLLLRPIERELAGVTRLLIVPDRELSRLSFAGLWDAQRGEYVVERFAVTTVPSAAFVAAARRKRTRTEAVRPSVLVVGDPAFDEVALPQLVRLPGAAQEATDVAQRYRRSRVLVGEYAQRDTVVAHLQQHSVFHFAGHAVANSEQPELSFLALVPNGEGEDGLLRAREIGQMRLSNLSMVVLSACNTLGARPSHAGALAGLAYSFLRAGAPATVSSLWDVDDGSTRLLLLSFHQHLSAGLSAPDALRYAQLDRLRSQRREQRSPRVWAAFIYTGP